MAVIAFAVLACTQDAIAAYSADASSREGQQLVAEASSPAEPVPTLSYADGHVEVVQEGIAARAVPLLLRRERPGGATSSGAAGVSVRRREGIAARAVPLLLLPGDSVRTQQGRAEIVFTDGTLVHLADRSEIELLDGTRLRLSTGHVILRVARDSMDYIIDTRASTVALGADGEYRLAVGDSGLELAVARGTARLGGGAGLALGAGLAARLAGPDARPIVESFNMARADAFDWWSRDRVSAVLASPSASRLPYELRAYGPVLDHHGRWQYLAPHGNVWVPAVVAGWRPYHDGFWSFTVYGWTWCGRDPFAWPTHHFGRWGFAGGFWYWIPARRWAPAWVSWTILPRYVGWAPLGWDGRAVIAGLRHRRDHPVYWPPDGRWGAWTFAPRADFGPRRSVPLHGLSADRLDEESQRRLADVAVTIWPKGEHALPRRAIVGTASRGAVRRPDAGDITSVPAARSRVDAPGFVPPSTQRADAPHDVGRARRRAILRGAPGAVESGKPAPPRVPAGSARAPADARAFVPPSSWRRAGDPHALARSRERSGPRTSASPGLPAHAPSSRESLGPPPDSMRPRDRAVTRALPAPSPLVAAPHSSRARERSAGRSPAPRASVGIRTMPAAPPGPATGRPSAAARAPAHSSPGAHGAASGPDGARRRPPGP
jgi:hypothetical protein